MDIEEIIQKIKSNFSEEDLTNKLEDEILNWVDSDWEEDGEYNSEYDWYLDYGRGEAENEIVKEMIELWKEKYNNGKEPDAEKYCKIYDKIVQEYEFLDKF